jgi:hypothetical protein
MPSEIACRRTSAIGKFIFSAASQAFEYKCSGSRILVGCVLMTMVFLFPIREESKRKIENLYFFLACA